MGALAHDEAHHLQVALGAFAIVCGIILLSYEKDAATEDGQSEATRYRGVAYALATAMAWSISITVMNASVKEAFGLSQALTINTVRVLGIAIVFLAVSPVIGKNISMRRTGKTSLIALVLGGVVALGLGWFFLTYSLMETLESRAVPISSTTPLFSTLAAMAFLREKPRKKTVLGSIMVVAGIALIFLL
ncbi:MAG: DMT family transporter [Candidatus Bathyarchaeota archaeon]|nr:DMT family transporter [Candidatus Bathyarchaeota archaeon]